MQERTGGNHYPMTYLRAAAGLGSFFVFGLEPSCALSERNARVEGEKNKTTTICAAPDDKYSSTSCTTRRHGPHVIFKFV